MLFRFWVRLGCFILAGAVAFVAALRVLCCPQVLAVQNTDTSFAIVMYHHISRDSSDAGKYVITAEQLEQDFIYLKERGYHTLTVRELYAIDRGERPLAKKSIMLTFDDGQESFYAYAYPLLKKYGFSAVLSVIGGYTEQFSTHPDHTISYSHVTWEQLKEMAGSGLVEYANHSYDMHQSGAGGRRGVTPKAGESETEYRAALLEDIHTFNGLFLKEVGFTPGVFTYPFGAYTDWTEQIVRSAGYTAAFTCREIRVVPRSKEDWLYRLGRYNRSGHEQTEHYFKRLSVY